MSMTRRSAVFLAALAMIATLVPLTSQAKKQVGKVIQPFPAVHDFTMAEMKQLTEQWAGKVYDYVPPRGGVRVLSQPDGSTFDALLTGAEIGGRFETLATGHTVVKNSGGWWTYALKSKKQAGQVVPSKKIVGRSAPAGIPARIGRTDPMWKDKTTGGDIRTQLFEYFRSESVAATQAAQAAGEVRKLKIPMLLLETQGEFQPGSMPEPTEDFLNGYGKEKPTVTEFYMEMSWGQLLAEVDVYGPYKSIRASSTRATTAASRPPETETTRARITNSSWARRASPAAAAWPAWRPRPSRRPMRKLTSRSTTTMAMDTST